MQTPGYSGFFGVVRNAQFTTVENPLKLIDGNWEMDLEAMSSQIDNIYLLRESQIDNNQIDPIKDVEVILDYISIDNTKECSNIKIKEILSSKLLQTNIDNSYLNKI